MFPSAEKHITFKLCGESLETAIEIHEHEKIANEAYKELQVKALEYQEHLLNEFDAIHTPVFNKLLKQLADQLSIPFEDIVQYRLDAGYLEDHGVAFLKHYPIKSIGN